MKRERKQLQKASCALKPIFLSDQGFTLLEVLLAFFIFAILFVTIYTSYSGSFKTINTTESRMEMYRKAAIALERISEDLQSSYISLLTPDSFGKPAGYTDFVGEDKEINGQGADTLSFFATIPPLFGNDDAAASGQLISYSVVQGSGEDELVLLRTENPEFSDNTEAKEGLVLADGLQAVNFAYFDLEGEEYESWDSAGSQFNGRLPRLVLVSLEFFNEDNPEMPLQVMTRVLLPVNYLPKMQ